MVDMWVWVAAVLAMSCAIQIVFLPQIDLVIPAVVLLVAAIVAWVIDRELGWSGWLWHWTWGIGGPLACCAQICMTACAIRRRR